MGSGELSNQAYNDDGANIPDNAQNKASPQSPQFDNTVPNAQNAEPNKIAFVQTEKEVFHFGMHPRPDDPADRDPFRPQILPEKPLSPQIPSEKLLFHQAQGLSSASSASLQTQIHFQNPAQAFHVHTGERLQPLGTPAD